MTMSLFGWLSHYSCCQAFWIVVIARSEATKQSIFCPDSGLLRGACHRAALCADPLARNDGLRTIAYAIALVRFSATLSRKPVVDSQRWSAPTSSARSLSYSRLRRYRRRLSPA